MNGNEEEYESIIIRMREILKNAITEYVSLRYEEWKLNETVGEYLQHFSEESRDEKVEDIENVIYDEVESHIKDEKNKLRKAYINEVFNIEFEYKDIKDIVDGFYVEQIINDIESEIPSEPYEDYDEHEKGIDEFEEIKDMFERNIEHE